MTPYDKSMEIYIGIRNLCMFNVMAMKYITQSNMLCSACKFLYIPSGVIKYVSLYIPEQTPEEDRVGICNHQTDSPRARGA